MPAGTRLPLRRILVLSIGGRVRTAFLGSNLGYVLPLGKVLRGNSATDISINLTRELEVSGIGLYNTRWLVYLLALLQELFILSGAIILHITVLLQVVHHLFDRKTLAL